MRSYQKRGRLFIFVAVIFVLAAAFAANGQDAPFSTDTSPLPPSTGFVNDFAGVLDTATKQQIEAKLKNLKETTNPQVEIAVAIVKTTGDRPIFDYSIAVARGWKIGSKLDDNPSALLLVAVDDRKYFTQVSRNLEDELPDALAGSLQRQFLVPEFKKGNYGKGISDTIDAYITAIRNAGNAPSNTNTPAKTTPVKAPSFISSWGFCCCLILIIVILIFIFARRPKGPTSGDRNRWGGGGFGSRGSTATDVAVGALPWIVSGILNGGSSSSDSGGSSSSDWGGSSGGSDWGGFGGGGDFGGGGAGGDW